MMNLSTYLQYSHNNDNEKKFLKEEINMYKKVSSIYLTFRKL